MSYIVELSNPISYANKGEMQESTFVELIAPNFKQLDNFIPVKQAFISAVTDLSEVTGSAQSESNNDEDEKITGPQIIAVMMRSSCDMTKVYLHCKELFRSGAALLDGEQKMTVPIIEAMPLRDFEKLVGEYIANFIAASLIDGM